MVDFTNCKLNKQYRQSVFTLSKVEWLQCSTPDYFGWF